MQCKFKPNFFCCSLKLREYSVYGVNVVSSNPFVGPLPRIKIFFFILSAFKEELLSNEYIITFLPNLLRLDKEKVPRVSNSILYPEKELLPRSAF